MEQCVFEVILFLFWIALKLVPKLLLFPCEIGIFKQNPTVMKILFTLICSAFLFCFCECDSRDKTATETDGKIIAADTLNECLLPPFVYQKALKLVFERW